MHWACWLSALHYVVQWCYLFHIFSRLDNALFYNDIILNDCILVIIMAPAMSELDLNMFLQLHNLIINFISFFHGELTSLTAVPCLLFICFISTTLNLFRPIRTKHVQTRVSSPALSRNLLHLLNEVQTMKPLERQKQIC